MFVFSADPIDVDFYTQVKKRKQKIKEPKKTRRDYAKMSVGLMGEEDIDDSICSGLSRFHSDFSIVCIPHTPYYDFRYEEETKHLLPFDRRSRDHWEASCKPQWAGQTVPRLP